MSFGASAARLASCALIWVAASAAAAVIAGSSDGGLTPLRCALALSAGACVAAAYAAWSFTAAGRPENSTAPWRKGFWGAATLAVFALAALRSSLWLVVESGGELKVGSPYNIGDLALHWQMIEHLASGAKLWPENPIFLEGSLKYPAGINLWNALFRGLGLPLAPILVWSMLLGSALTAWALWRWAGAFGVATLLFSGGAAGFLFFSPSWPPGPSDAIEWKNLFLSVFVTQRGFLWALPAGLLLMDCWRRAFDGRSAPLPLWAQSLLYGAMPLFHLHTFLFLSALLAVCFLAAKGARRRFFLVAAYAFLPASVFVWLVTGGFDAGGAFGWHPGWMQGERGLGFWAINFGISLPLFLWLAFEIARGKDKTAAVFAGTGLVFLLLCFFFRFAPWAWDNVKLMLWSFLAVAPFLWERVIRPLGAPLRAAVLVLLFFSGALFLLQGLSSRHLHGWISSAELREARSVLRGVAASASRVAVKPDVPHPVALCGYPVAVGYPGHLWSHGTDYRPAEVAIEQFFRSGHEADILSPVTHVFVGRREREAFGENIWLPPPPGWREVARQGQARLYEREPRLQQRQPKGSGAPE